MTTRAQHEQPEEDGRGGEARHRTGAGPAPVVPLDDTEVDQGQGRGEERGSEQVGHRASARRPTLDELVASDPHGHDPEGDVDQEGPSPASELDEGATGWWA